MIPVSKEEPFRDAIVHMSAVAFGALCRMCRGFRPPSYERQAGPGARRLVPAIFGAMIYTTRAGGKLRPRFRDWSRRFATAVN